MWRCRVDLKHCVFFLRHLFDSDENWFATKAPSCNSSYLHENQEPLRTNRTFTASHIILGQKWHHNYVSILRRHNRLSTFYYYANNINSSTQRETDHPQGRSTFALARAKCWLTRALFPGNESGWFLSTQQFYLSSANSIWERPLSGCWLLAFSNFV